MGPWSCTGDGLATASCADDLQIDIADPLRRVLHVPAGSVERALPRMVRFGFKVLLDLFASSARAAGREHSLQFREATEGREQLDTMIVWRIRDCCLPDKLVAISFRPLFALRADPGDWGSLSFATLWTSLNMLGFSLAWRRPLPRSNGDDFEFLYEQSVHYRDQQLRGLRLVRGLVSFYLICGLGAVANVALRPMSLPRTMLGGCGVGRSRRRSVFHFAMFRQCFTWNRRKLLPL